MSHSAASPGAVQLQWNILDVTKEEFWDYPQDSRIYSVLGRLPASHYKMVWRNFAAFFSFFFCSFSIFLSVWGFFFMYESGRLCIRFWFMWSMNAVQNTHSHKAISVSWYTNVTCVKGIYPVAHTAEGKYCALQEHIIKMNTSRVSGICPCNQDNKERKKRGKTKIEIG